MKHNFLEQVKQEADRTRKIHPSFHSYHEAFGVIYEEVQEFFDYVRSSPDKMGLTKEEFNLKVKAELVQVAAMCLCCAEELCDKETK